MAATLSTNPIDWRATCGFHDGYGDKNGGPSGVLSEVTFGKKKPPMTQRSGGMNSDGDMKLLDDGTYSDTMFLNETRTDFNKRDWMGVVLHELLHGSTQVDNAAAFLASEFFEDAGEPCNNKDENPLGLNFEQKLRARAIIEEIMVRRLVEQLATRHPLLLDAASPLDVVGECNKPDIYPDADLLTPDQENALRSFMDNNAAIASSPCKLSLEGPLQPMDCRGMRVELLFEAAEENTSPLILDLDGDGVETLVQNFYIHFDHDKNGFAERTGWVGADDGLLVLDRNGNGSIDNGSELFGNHSGSGPGWANGFAALAEFDSNLDGRIDTSDTAFASLRVWKDANSNGLTDAGELLTLQQAGVGSLSLSYTTGSVVDAQGNSHRQLGSYTTTQGALRQMTDVWFTVDAMRCGVRRCGRGGARGQWRKHHVAGVRGRSQGLDWLTKTGHGPVRAA